MRFSLLLATCLAVSAPLCAQPTPEPAKKLATIQPEARDLLARLDARYKKFKTFQCLIEVHFSEPIPWKYARYRVALDWLAQATVTSAIEGQGTQHSVYDGKTILSTDSRFPKRYTVSKLDAERYGTRIFLRHLGVKGQTVGLLTNDDLASALLDPDLQSVEMGASEKVGDKTLRSIVFKLENSQTKASLKLLIDADNLVLYRVVGTDITPASSGKTFTFTEDYSDIRFDEKLSPDLFSTKPPSDFRAINSFENSMRATAVPVEDAVTK